MILKLSLTVLLLYYLVVLWKYYRQDIAGDIRDSGDGRRHGGNGKGTGATG